jgi:hypothetical protein
MLRTFSSRFDILRNGVKYSEIYPIVSAPNIYANKSAEIKMSLSGRFKHNSLVDYLTDEIRPIVIIDGAEHPCGVFCAGSVNAVNDEYGASDNIEAYDRCYILKSTKTESILHLAAGTNYITAIGSLLTAAGIVLAISTPTSYTLTTDREDWDIGTDYLTIINALLSEINYNDIWFNADGYAIMEPYTKPDVNSIDHHFDTSNSSIVTPLARDVSVETDIFDKPNVLIAVCSNADLSAPLVATAENNNPISALSIIRRGRRIAEIKKVDNIASQAALQDYANRVCFESMLSSEVVTVKTPIEPGHGIGDIVALNHPQIQGICEETAWRMNIKAGEYMTHELKKVIFT